MAMVTMYNTLKLIIITFFFVLCTLLCVYCFEKLFPLLYFWKQKVNIIRVMTFNTWHEGSHMKKGTQKIASHIRHIDPDLVALQEIRSPEALQDLLKEMGPLWTGRFAYPDIAIISKHAFEDISPRRNKNQQNKVIRFIRSVIKIPVNNEFKVIRFKVYSLHLAYLYFGPNTACGNISVNNTDKINIIDLLNQGEFERINDIKNLQDDIRFQEDMITYRNEPILLLGDFNAPSHLDWTDRLKHKHCGQKFQWPVTKMMENLGFIDAYRQIYPDPLESPGFTWTVIENIRNPAKSERIDFVYHKSGILHNVNATVYSGSGVNGYSPNHSDNDWPSDHASVIVDYTINI